MASKYIEIDGSFWPANNPITKYNYHYRRCIDPKGYGIKRGDGKYLYSLGFVDGINRNKKRSNSSTYNFGYKAGKDILKKK